MTVEGFYSVFGGALCSTFLSFVLESVVYVVDFSASTSVETFWGFSVFTETGAVTTTGVVSVLAGS